MSRLPHPPPGEGLFLSLFRYNKFTKKSERLYLSFLRLLLTNGVSRGFGKFASTKFPKPLQNLINTTYVKMFTIDMSRFSAPATYQSLNALFTRPLTTPLTFTNDPQEMISPCDSLIVECGDIRGMEALQIKGMSYGVQELLGPYHRASTCRDGFFMNFYLSPRDYHRYHAPCDMLIKSSTHIPGLLYPVNIPALENIPSLYVQNERVILECETHGMTFFMVFVGALNVGTMVFNFDPHIVTNKNNQAPSHRRYDHTTVRKGDELGRFDMGSTIVMLMPEGIGTMSVSRDDVVKFGDRIMVIG